MLQFCLLLFPLRQGHSITEDNLELPVLLPEASPMLGLCVIIYEGVFSYLGYIKSVMPFTVMYGAAQKIVLQF